MANWTEDESLNKFIKEKEIKKRICVVFRTRGYSILNFGADQRERTNLERDKK